MAVRIIEGAIGSGKTYYAVDHIVKSYFRWDKHLEKWDSIEDVDIYTNIDGFKLGLSLQDAIKQAGGASIFFTKQYQNTFVPENKKVIYFIDEAQGSDFFHRKFYNTQVFDFFTYSRHYGVDVYLLTQDIKNMAPSIQDLAEYVISVKRRSLSLSGEFTYRFISGGESFKTRSLRPEQRIFALYRSMSKKETEKIPSASRRFVFIFAGLIAFAVVFFYLFITIFFRPSKPQTVKPSLPPAVNAPLALSAGLESSIRPSRPVPVSVPGSVLPEASYGVDMGVSSRLLLVVGVVGSLEDNSGFVLYRSASADNSYLYRASNLEFDRLCRCNSLGKLKAGDVLQAL